MFFAAAAVALAGCQTYGNDEGARYLQRKDTVTLSAGDASQANAVAQTIHPWPPGVGDRNIPMQGTRRRARWNAIARVADSSWYRISRDERRISKTSPVAAAPQAAGGRRGGEPAELRAVVVRAMERYRQSAQEQQQGPGHPRGKSLVPPGEGEETARTSGAGWNENIEAGGGQDVGLCADECRRSAHSNAGHKGGTRNGVLQGRSQAAQQSGGGNQINLNVADKGSQQGNWRGCLAERQPSEAERSNAETVVS